MNERSEESQREYGLDVIKLICSLLVVYIHAGADLGVFNSLTLTAVPAFFIISGFLYDKVILPGEGQRKQIIRMSRLFVMAFTFYCCFCTVILVQVDSGKPLLALGEQFSVIPLLKLILLNAPTYGYHLWYISALIYVLLICWFTDRLFSRKNWKAVCFVLFGTGILLPILCRLAGLPFREELVRNFLFEGLPMFYLGRYVADRRRSLCSWQITKTGIVGVGLLVCLLVEALLYNAFSISTPLRLMPCCIAIYMVVIGLLAGEKVHKGTVLYRLARIGGGYSSVVYICHMVFVIILKQYGIQSSMKCFALVCAFSFLTAFIWKAFCIKRHT